jgi:hypothetical protein
MKVTGCTFIRNAEKYDYPIVSSLQSLLPLCDEVIVVLGNSEDNTENWLRNIGSDKISIHPSIWNDALREGGAVLAIETNKGLDLVPKDADWVIYLQGDEIIHEKDYDCILSAMEKYKNDSEIDGILFQYKHFYGSYEYIADSRKWYRKEIRIVRNDKSIRSYNDAQGFRKSSKKLKVVEISATIYHYGWVKNPFQQQLKQKNFNKLWHDDVNVTKIVDFEKDNYDYDKIDSLVEFDGTHPAVMKERIAKQDWQFKTDNYKRKLSFKESISRIIEQQTGCRIGEYRNYKIVKSDKKS